MNFNIREYLDSLPDDTRIIDLYDKSLTYLPNLLRFNKLETLILNKNKLTSLPPLNENLEKLYCNYNQLTSLPPLNKNLKLLICTANKLTSLPLLNKNLQVRRDGR